MKPANTGRFLMIPALLLAASTLSGTAQETVLPAGPLQFGVFSATFEPDGSFTIEGEGWPKLTGRYVAKDSEIEIHLAGDEGTDALPEGCEKPGRYSYLSQGGHLELTLIADECTSRRMILGDSDWRPEGEPALIPERNIAVTTAHSAQPLPEPSSPDASWPSFRGPFASGVADGMNLPDTWSAETGENILWQTNIPGLAHSSPVIWGDTLFVTSAVSSKAEASFRPGLYGDGDASADRSVHRFEISALDKRTGKVLWTRVADESEPSDKRHIKATYANATPATDGQVVVASFGSQGVYGYDTAGNFLWKVDLGRINLGAYDVPSYEWGPASSPILWHGVVFLQCDNQTDSFVIALDSKTGKVLWKAERDELPTWGTPTIVTATSGAELVTNGAKFIRGYDPMTGDELWKLGRSSKITAPTPITANGLIVVTSGRAPERPIFVLRPGAKGDITLAKDETANESVVWSIERRGSYMPTPLIYDGLLYVLGNNGVFDAYELETGKEIYRERTTHGGSGFSGSPVAADGKIYLPSEDGEILVLAAGREFKHLATNEMGDLLMATPALSEGVMYIRSAAKLFAVGRESTSP